MRCNKGKAAAIETWFEGLSLYEAAGVVDGSRIQKAWDRLGLHDSTDKAPPSASEIMDRYHHGSVNTYGEDIRNRMGWIGFTHVMAMSSTVGSEIVTDRTLPPAH